MAASASSCSSSMSTGTVRMWRTAFLTLRDETLQLNESIGSLLHRLIFSLSPILVSASPLLPPQEVTSDLLFMLELAASSSQSASQDQLPVLSGISQLMHDVCRGQRFPLEFNSSSWTSLLGSFSILLHTALINPSADTVRPAFQCLETLRHLVNVNKQKFSLSDDVQLVKFLLHVIESSHTQLFSPSYPCQRSHTVTRKGPSSYVALCEIHTVAFMMLGESFTRLGSSFPADTWQVAIEVLRKVTDASTSKRLLAEDYTMSRMYSSLFSCLHMALVDPKGSLVDHVSGFVATLRLFFVYGLSSRPKFIGQANGLKEKAPDMMSLKLNPGESRGKVQAPYRPPHLRKRGSLKSNQSSCFSDGEYSTPDLTSSDSDCSDSDISIKENDDTQSFKVRVAAIVCIQDLCQADPKSFTSQWTMLLPTHDVLQPRKSEATLMTCLLFDPYMKARITSASALATMLDGAASVFLQIAEYNESPKWGSFMALSSSLGCILMQLHTGILYLIERETHSRLLASLFKILVLLISSTPYSRMPGELLPTVVTSLLTKIENGSTFKSDRAGQLAAIINCFTAALSTSPSSPQVKTMLLEEKPTDVLGFETKSGLLCTLFWYADQPTSPPTCFEALQALRAMAHNYPDVTLGCWEQILALVSKISGLVTVDIPQRTWKEHTGDNAGFIGEKVITSAIKVLDECLRALSGFKGTEEFMDDKFWDTPFTSDCIRAKKVSSAPVFESGSSKDTESESRICQSGIECWSKTIEKPMPRFLRCTSVMVRTATVTCFAGITSSVFFSFTKEKQEFIVSSLIDAALKDGVPSVRSAACRAIGVISYFPLVPQSSEMLEKFIHAVEINSHDNLVSVRITASWALANICESLRHYMAAFTSKMTRDSIVSTALMAMLAECALRLTKDGDKIKSNAVRALGNLSRFVKCTSSSDMHDKLRESLVLSTDNITHLPPTSNLQSGHRPHSLNPNLLGGPYLVEEIVQAFLSCVTTGNVKVQWNVCYALSHLFLNETLRLQDMDWAPSVFSILLLLLRDSSNFKIRIQAAAALAVPASAIDYGKSFPDVVQGLTNILENLSCVQISAPASFKYKVALEKQVTSTMLHVLGLSSSRDHELLKDFLVKKAPFLEDWFKALCSSLEETNTVEEGENYTQKQKKHMISKAIRSLMEIYENGRHYAITQKFEKLSRSMQ